MFPTALAPLGQDMGPLGLMLVEYPWGICGGIFCYKVAPPGFHSLAFGWEEKTLIWVHLAWYKGCKCGCLTETSLTNMSIRECLEDLKKDVWLWSSSCPDFLQCRLSPLLKALCPSAPCVLQSLGPSSPSPWGCVCWPQQSGVALCCLHLL